MQENNCTEPESGTSENTNVSNALHKLKWKNASVVANAVSGTIGSLLAEATLFPVDKIKLQVQTAKAGDSRGFVGTLVSIVRQAGIRGLYRGIGAALIKETVHSLNYWLWYGFLFAVCTEFEDTSGTSTMRRLLLNLLAKQLNWLCTVPFEVVSSVNQVSANNPGFLATALSLYEEGGVGAFYRGLTVSLLLAINPAIMNTLITSLLRLRALALESCGAGHSEARQHSAAVIGSVTGISKIIATVLTYPLIRAKVLQQTANAVFGQSHFVQVIKQVVALEGIAGLYRGMLAMSYKTVLWNSLMMIFKHLLGPKRAITPPASPRLAPIRNMPLMAREPFPVEYLSQEKLDEILCYLQRGSSNKKLEALERRVDEATGEIREVRKMLAELLARSDGASAGRSVSFTLPGDERVPSRRNH
eukprot:TRINITY_DN2208_c0_g2_i2.p1 TRINITY_DN2208_c0_g2~~TRINITY_DN2208_c0_g2_i2.p1  ORF type:complete len:417 (+),score=53.56 TRINITY_DN2208_c0_g2_i2:125-1375(+)